MGWLQKLFSKAKPKGSAVLDQAVSMTGYQPTFTSFGNNIYQSDIILSAIHLKMRYFGKMQPKHIREKDGVKTRVTDSSIARILEVPNDFSTMYDFLTQAFFMREKDGTCFIYPDYYEDTSGTRIYTGMYILLPVTTPIVEEDLSGKLFIRFEFVNPAREVVFPYEDIIVWKQDMEDNQFLGGGRFATMGRGDLLNNLEVYHTSTQAMAEASKMGCFLDGIIKVNAYASDNDKVKKIRDEFINDLRTNKSGLGVLDQGADFVSASRALKTIDASALKEIKDNILIHTGLTLEMLMGNMTPDQERSFYENHIEPASISLEQAMTKVFFSQWQRSHGDRIVIYPQEIDRMLVADKLKLVELSQQSGLLTYDEMRHLFGYAPLADGEGTQRPRAYNNVDGNKKDDKIKSDEDNVVEVEDEQKE
jgi:hypothetical protein